MINYDSNGRNLLLYVYQLRKLEMGIILLGDNINPIKNTVEIVLQAGKELRMCKIK